MSKSNVRNLILEWAGCKPVRDDSAAEMIKRMKYDNQNGFFLSVTNEKIADKEKPDYASDESCSLSTLAVVDALVFMRAAGYVTSGAREEIAGSLFVEALFSEPQLPDSKCKEIGPVRSGQANDLNGMFTNEMAYRNPDVSKSMKKKASTKKSKWKDFINRFMKVIWSCAIRLNTSTNQFIRQINEYQLEKDMKDMDNLLSEEDVDGEKGKTSQNEEKVLFTATVPTVIVGFDNPVHQEKIKTDLSIKRKKDREKSIHSTAEKDVQDRLLPISGFPFTFKGLVEDDGLTFAGDSVHAKTISSGASDPPPMSCTSTNGNISTGKQLTSRLLDRVSQGNLGVTMQYSMKTFDKYVPYPWDLVMFDRDYRKDALKYTMVKTLHILTHAAGSFPEKLWKLDIESIRTYKEQESLLMFQPVLHIVLDGHQLKWEDVPLEIRNHLGYCPPAGVTETMKDIFDLSGTLNLFYITSGVPDCSTYLDPRSPEYDKCTGKRCFVGYLPNVVADGVCRITSRILNITPTLFTSMVSQEHLRLNVGLASSHENGEFDYAIFSHLFARALLTTSNDRFVQCAMEHPPTQVMSLPKSVMHYRNNPELMERIVEYMHHHSSVRRQARDKVIPRAWHRLSRLFTDEQCLLQTGMESSNRLVKAQKLGCRIYSVDTDITVLSILACQLFQNLFGITLDIYVIGHRSQYPLRSKPHEANCVRIRDLFGLRPPKVTEMLMDVHRSKSDYYHTKFASELAILLMSKTNDYDAFELSGFLMGKGHKSMADIWWNLLMKKAIAVDELNRNHHIVGRGMNNINLHYILSNQMTNDLIMGDEIEDLRFDNDLLYLIRYNTTPMDCTHAMHMPVVGFNQVLMKRYVQETTMGNRSSSHKRKRGGNAASTRRDTVDIVEFAVPMNGGTEEVYVPPVMKDRSKWTELDQKILKHTYYFHLLSDAVLGRTTWKRLRTIDPDRVGDYGYVQNE